MRSSFVNRRNFGVSLLELIVVIAIIGASFFILRVVINLLTGLFQNSATVESQREVQGALYEVVRDTRNSFSILEASSDTLKLQTFNLQGGYTPTNTNLFNPVFLGTVTYRYENDGVNSHLKRTVELFGVAPQDRILLRNILIKPDVENYLFAACSEADFFTGNRCPPNSIPPNESIVAVDIRFTVSPLYVASSSMTYAAQVMRRSRW